MTYNHSTMRLNYIKGIHLSELEPGDTIYLQKTHSRDFPHIFLCEFISFERGLVTGKVIAVPEEYMGYYIGDEYRVRKTNACLWGWDGKSMLGGRNIKPYPHYYFHWFAKDGYVEGE